MRKIPKHFVRPIPLPSEEKPASEESVDQAGAPFSAQRLAGRLEPLEDYWPWLGIRIAMAGAAYPLCLIVVLAAFAVFLVIQRLLLGNYLDWGSAMIGLLIAAMFYIPVAVGCYLYAGVVAIFVLLPVAGVLKLLRWKPRWESLGLFCGGLVAYVCFLPLLYDLPNLFGGTAGSATSWLSIVILFLLGPGLATLCGQVGGAHAGVSNRRTLEAYGRTETPWRFSFSLRQLMLTTMVVSLLLGGLKLAELLDSPWFLYTGFWLMWQSVSRFPALWVARWMHGRRSSARSPT